MMIDIFPVSEIHRLETEFGFIELLITNNYDDGIDMLHFGKVIAIVQNIQLNEGVEKNMGYGQELYIEALKKYSTLYSTFPVSDEAFNAQNSLIKKGAVIRGYETLGEIDFLTMTIVV